MTECKVEYLENVMASLAVCLRYEEALLIKIRPRFEQFKKRYNGSSIGYCLSRYIKSELDSATPGNRGVGRNDGRIPRFGAYYRKALRGQPGARVAQLYDAIQHLILCGYLLHVLMLEEPVSRTAVLSGEPLYEKWITRIYTEHSLPSKGALRKVFLLFVTAAMDEVKRCMDTHNIRAARLFGKDPIDAILAYYACAGFFLRITEVNP